MTRAPDLSEPKHTTFPTYQVPQQQESAMRGRRATPVQHAARDEREGRAALPFANPAGAAVPRRDGRVAPPSSVIAGSSRRPAQGDGQPNVKMQSVTENCLLNSVTVPKIQRNGHVVAAHNNISDKLDSSKFGALPIIGRDIPTQKSEDLQVLNALKFLDDGDDYHPLRLRGGGDESLNMASNNDDSGQPIRKPDDGLRADSLPLTSATASFPDNDNNTVTRRTESHNKEMNFKDCNESENLNRNAGLYVPLRLRGGGESSLSTGTSGWGSPPSQQANNNNANKTNQNGQQPPTSQSTTGWGQPGSKPASGSNPPASSTGTNGGQNNVPNNPSTTKQQLEQLNNMREAIFSQDGWGAHVNQDTTWDIPTSPEPKMDGSGGGGPPPWKPNVNNGTELWEANLRNGGQPPPQPQQKTPWGHTPSTNIGGTWGEDDDATDSSNVWTGVPSNQQQWGNSNSSTMWGGAGGAGWGDPRSGDPRALDMRTAAAAAAMDPRQLDPRDQMRQMAAAQGGGDMRGDPRGITGRLNGAGAEAFWGGSGGPQHGAGLHHPGKMPPVGPTSGAAPSAGWEEPSPPSQRRVVPNYDDGTSFWGNPQQGGMSSRGNSAGGPPGMPQNRVKPDGWGQTGARNGWEESGQAGWEEPGPWPKKMGGGWMGDELDWSHKAGVKPQMTRDMVWNSKIRSLVDQGHKKEDVENALRMRDMNVDEALDILNPLRTRDAGGWGGRHDDHFDHSQFPGGGGGQRFQSAPTNPLSFQNTGPNLLNNMNSSAGNNLINNISPAGVQKMLTQGGGVQGFSGNGGGRNMQPQSQPSTQQLRMLVQQIQMAVQAGYLNHQILNQPLAPQTLVLLNQLLQQIKTLQQLVNQQTIATTQCINGKPNNAVMQCSVLITKTKQQITNLQNQIAAQQAIYVKQQHQGGMGGAYDSFKSNPMHDSINALQGNFADLTIAKDPQVNQQQSRLNQWINKDKEEGGEFSRAPGSSSKPMTSSPNMAPLGLTQPDGPWSSSGRSGDTGWPDSGAGDSSNDAKDAQWSAAQQSLTDLVPEFEPGKPWKGNQLKSIEDDPSITPGSVVRSPLSLAAIKDNELFSSMNPSKSPPAATAADAIQSLGLSSSTWSFNPPSSTTSAFASSPQSKLPSGKGLGDLNPVTTPTSELWPAPKSRGPPPGLPSKGGGGASLANGWSSQLSGSVPWGGGQRSSGNWGTSPWLLLRNLTAQIDGSTLRTLCMQHGPLLSFHLYLHQGFALAKYSSREEANKAQTALNNCVLGNTTILAENPTDWDANALLQNVANQQTSSGGWRGNSKQSVASGDTWSTGWPTNPTANLWATPNLDAADPARATPSSLNNFLPNDLLGGESM